jgi:hypothetical protein
MLQNQQFPDVRFPNRAVVIQIGPQNRSESLCNGDERRRAPAS